MDKIITEDGVEVLESTETIVSTRRIMKEELKQEVENWDYQIDRIKVELDKAKARKAEAQDKLKLFKQ